MITEEDMNELIKHKNRRTHEVSNVKRLELKRNSKQKKMECSKRADRMRQRARVDECKSYRAEKNSRYAESVKDGRVRKDVEK